MTAQTDNARVEELHAADQKDRATGYSSAEEVAALKERDRARRKELLELMGRNELSWPVDLYRAAVVFLHGSEAKDFSVAHRLAFLSALAGHGPARWLAAASLDRLQMSVGLPQTYGTQFEQDPANSRYQLRLPIDEAAIMHFEKKFLGVPSVMERLSQLNSRIAS